MSSLKIDLRTNSFFQDEELVLDKHINFIFGKNGTGKSTITDLIKEQATEYDVLVFQGINSVLQDDKLSAVILGTENTKIDNEIKEKNSEITALEGKIGEIRTNITEPVNGTINMYTECKKRKEAYSTSSMKLNTFYTETASHIKKIKDPQIADVNYNSPKFQNEIANRYLLSTKEKEKHKKTILSDEKVAREITYKELNLQESLISTNKLLEKMVKEKVLIPRLENNHEKREFAKTGLKLHKEGDVCSFCGNEVSPEEYSQLIRYFEVDEVKEFEIEIEEMKDVIKSDLFKIQAIQFNSDEFYPEYRGDIDRLSVELSAKKEKITDFFNRLDSALEDKKKELFNPTQPLEIDIPSELDDLVIEYRSVRDQNNSSNLDQEKAKARDALRYHEISLILDEFDYDNKLRAHEGLKNSFNEYKQLIEKEESKIHKLKEEIDSIQKDIRELQTQTESESLIADKINQKLRNNVLFELKHQDHKEVKGYYEILCPKTGNVRDISMVSTGEKNIIAFLYFIEKLEEITEEKSGQIKKDRIIIFDDPMNSNDDTMQYLIIEEIRNLFKKIKGNDKLILLTHNCHFYINVKYGRHYQNKKSPSKVDNFYRLNFNGHSVSINQITKAKDDFQTSYENLWKELSILYDSQETQAEILLNPIRRIIETFTKFNGINKVDFLSKVSGAKKLFDVNSHSIDDLEADLGGQTKEQIIKIAKACFENNNSIDHFNSFWNSLPNP